jgi:type II secretory pathway component GspD/PulD (secretin)
VAFVPSGWQTALVGWILEVLPSVGSDMKTINMRVVPTVRTRDGEQNREFAASVNDNGENRIERTNLPIPLFRTQTLDVNASVEDGKTLVIGGIYTAKDSDQERMTPGLGKLPLLGALFRTRANVKERNAMLIFVTATIVRPDNGTYTDIPMAYPALDELPGGELYIEPRKLNAWLGDPTLKTTEF